MKNPLFAFVTVVFVSRSGQANAAGDSIDHVVPPAQGWKHEGIFGSFDRAAAQRGLQVYREVCASCHSLRFVSFRTLTGIGFTEAEIKAIAAEYTLMADPNEDGDVLERPGLPFDYFPLVYANKEAAAASNNGAVPPDLSLMPKKRAGGEDYVYSLMTHYREPTAEDLAILEKKNISLGDTSYFNPIMSGNQIAMAPPLIDGLVEYAPGQPEATVEQMAYDVSVFLTWTAEPTLEDRKKLGFQVMIYLIIFCGIMFFAYRRIARRILGH
jgi:ubiquinol-cytochrome c reductase cytochrome c1 subunit